MMRKVLQHPERIEPGRGQESVWDYPRPPHLERSSKRIQVFFNGRLIADTTRAWRVLETSHPPIYYIPREDVRPEYITESTGMSYCEWKGRARYVGVKVGQGMIDGAGWYYPEPTSGFEPIRDHIAFYPGKMERCTVDGETVTPQPGCFYGGWVTADIVGPFKGESGTEFW